MAPMREKYRDKAAGSLIGLAVGDAFGDAARDPDNQFMYGITTDFPKKSTGSTDDTEFALLTAHILLDSSGLPDRQHVISAWKKHVLVQDEYRRGGASEREAAANLRKGIMPPESGIYNAYAMSDGAAMRSGPIGIICPGDPGKAAELALIDAEISHSRDGIWGAQAVAAAVSMAMAGADTDAVIDAARACAPEGSWLKHALDRSFAIIDEYNGVLEDCWMPLHEELACEYKAAVPEAVPSALAVFKLTGGDLRKGIIYSGNFGRDSDTIGAIVGAVSGALHGLKTFPSSWIDKVRKPNGTCLHFTKELDIVDTAYSLAALIK